MPSFNVGTLVGATGMFIGCLFSDRVFIEPVRQAATANAIDQAVEREYAELNAKLAVSRVKMDKLLEKLGQQMLQASRNSYCKCGENCPARHGKPCECGCAIAPAGKAEQAACCCDCKCGDKCPALHGGTCECGCGGSGCGGPVKKPG